MKNLIIITGLAGSGKSTLSHLYAKAINAGLVVSDEYRYYPNSWNKLPTEEFMDNIFKAINSKPQETVVYESSYHDASDPNHSRIKVITSLLPYASQVIIIKPCSLVEQTAYLIDRCIKRYTGEEKSGASEETSTSRARLVIKSVNNYPTNCQYLEDLKNSLNDKKVIYLPRDEVYQHLNLVYEIMK